MTNAIMAGAKSMVISIADGRGKEIEFYEPCMPFLFVGLWFCAPASFMSILGLGPINLPLPSVAFCDTFSLKMDLQIRGLGLLFFCFNVTHFPFIKDILSMEIATICFFFILDKNYFDCPTGRALAIGLKSLTEVNHLEVKTEPSTSDPTIVFHVDRLDPVTHKATRERRVFRYEKGTFNSEF